jgi:predicted Zn-dependent protease|tara:strand:+ start:29902 stop:31365 length:1464 start_codon:yes stop_codon:yes gene_type:complete
MIRFWPSLNHLALSFLLVILLTQTALANNPQDYGTNLPNIGDPASEVLSIGQEAELGKVLLAQINRRLPISTDPELRNYMQSLGTRLISSSLDSNFPYYFRLVFDPRINAFAMPGGIVAINSGLLLLTSSESELASVVAHEIAHVSQRHIARRFSRQKRLSILNAITMLGALVAAIYSSDAATATVAATMGGMHNKEMAYSRDYEREADRIGMNLLSSARLDPYGMPRFFDKLNSHSQINSDRPPEFLSSHPLTLSRISDSKIRASQYKQQQYSENTVQYHYARARAQAISSPPGKLITHYQKIIKDDPSNIDRYIYALALSRAGNNRLALIHLQAIKPTRYEEFPVSIALAQVNIAAGNNVKAIDLLKHLERLYPYNEAVTLYLSTALLETKRPLQALNTLDDFGITFSSNPALERLRAKAAELAGQPWRSHEALADYNLMHARYSKAIEHFILAERQLGIDQHSRERIKAKKLEVKEFRKKHNLR